MKMTLTRYALAAVMVCAACGEAGPGRPEGTTQPVGTLGPPQGTPPDVGPLPEVANFDVPELAPGSCCPVAFAILADDGAYASVMLLGEYDPLATGVALTYSDGAWRGSACIPPGYDGYYFYEGQRELGGDAGTAAEQLTNAFAPTAQYVQWGTVNVLAPVADCSDASLSAHDDTTPPTP